MKINSVTTSQIMNSLDVSQPKQTKQQASDGKASVKQQASKAVKLELSQNDDPTKNGKMEKLAMLNEIYKF